MEKGETLARVIYLVSMKFHLIASGSKGNCFILQNDKRVIVIDCGGTRRHLISSFNKLGIDINKIDLLLITHSHSDHISQLPVFKNCLVYSPVYLEKREDAKILRPRQTFKIDKMVVTPIPLSHDSGITVGYIFECNNEKLVYVTDTGYVHSSNIELMKDADYIVIESNHDLTMLMNSSRPQYLKSRIKSDTGHLCNEDCAVVLEKIVSKKTKKIILAHISEETNTYELALKTNVDYLLENKRCDLNNDLKIVAARQFEIVSGGIDYEESFNSDYSISSCVEWVFNV